jgi:hypothetical protein
MKNRLLIALLMLMPFISQTMASTAMACVHQVQHNDFSMMTHHSEAGPSTGEMISHTDMNSENKVDESMMDCCKVQCQCAMSSCFSFSALLNYTFNAYISGEQKIAQLPSLVLPQVNSSLYRPPIS